MLAWFFKVVPVEAEDQAFVLPHEPAVLCCSGEGSELVARQCPFTECNSWRGNLLSHQQAIALTTAKGTEALALSRILGRAPSCPLCSNLCATWVHLFYSELILLETVAPRSRVVVYPGGTYKRMVSGMNHSVFCSSWPQGCRWSSLLPLALSILDSPPLDISSAGHLLFLGCGC